MPTFAQDNTVSFESLVSFDGIFDEMKQVFIDIIKEGGVLFISLAVIIMLLKYLQAFMGDNSKFKEAEQLKEREARIAKQAQRIEDKREAALLERQREHTGYVEDFEGEYKNRELQSRIDNSSDKEFYTIVCCRLHFGIVYFHEICYSCVHSYTEVDL